jgi:hypothetical protein
MQLNVYIPKDKAYILDALDRVAEQSGLSKNEIVLEALERRVKGSHDPEYSLYELDSSDFDRGELYRHRIG